jgi:C4-dicarboxylate-specific signal transduction histidine kinase
MRNQITNFRNSAAQFFLGLMAVVAFFLTSLIVARLIENARKEKESAIQAEANLRRSEADLHDSEREWREVFEHNPLMYLMDADQMFDAFFTTKSSGLGMGLSICRSIPEAHGGRLSVSCNEGPGATFQFVLPLHHEDAS